MENLLFIQQEVNLIYLFGIINTNITGDPCLILYNLKIGKVIKRHFGHRDTLYSIEQFENRNLVASGGRDRSIKIWRLSYYPNDYKNGMLEKMVFYLKMI